MSVTYRMCKAFPYGRAFLVLREREIKEFREFKEFSDDSLNSLSSLNSLNSLSSPPFYTHTVHFLFEASLIKKLFRKRSKEFVQ